ncbi:MAG TPA: peptide ABC transporter permease [Proteiniclasticum sp.]|uniref:ABC transporter permease n=1 Tax=Proteiniclasticum sp. TaxID=2053595 RepID=UPI000E8CECA7|nr:ABC transporter permease [Proteiniclasticum sp.]HBW12573.1 peptide ABC transporter permease [Proteiniclasticum sp.]
MKKYILKRIGIAALTLLVILFILFIMLELMPGSPFNDEKLTDAQRAIINAKYGLDKPVFLRFFNYLKAMLSGDFGVSYNISKNTPITQLLESRLPLSLRIGGQAVLIGTAVGIVLGLIAAVKHNTIFDTLTTVISVLGVSLPSYVFAMALIYSMGFKLKWFPLLYELDEPFHSTVLPTVALSMFTIATVARFTRTEMLEVLGSEYMLLAESKGMHRNRLIFVHALRNALIPIITVLAPLVVSLMTGSLVIEKLFSIPGIGSLMVTAIQSNDYNVIIALAFVYSVMFISIMLVVDILYGIIDPRIRLAKENLHE